MAAPHPIEWRWNALEQNAWAALIACAERPTLEQSWAYGAAIERVSAYRAQRGVAYREGQPIALLQLFTRPLLGALTVAKILRGPVALAPLSADAFAEAMQPVVAARRIRYLRPLFWLPELPEGVDADALMRRLGKRPMIRGNATGLIDLTPEEDDLRRRLNPTWRNKLGRAEKQKLRVQIAHSGQTVELLAQRHEAFRRSHRHRNTSGAEVKAMLDALEPKRDALVMTAYTGSMAVAGMLLMIHGRGATYHVAWTSPEGRSMQAHNLLLWRGLLALKQRGVAFLDLGGLDARTPGVVRFKLDMGAKVVPLAATYL